MQSDQQTWLLMWLASAVCICWSIGRQLHVTVLIVYLIRLSIGMQVTCLAACLEAM